MSRSATPATRNKATPPWKPPKMTTSAELPIRTAIRGSHERLRNVERTHPQPPDPQSETGTLAMHSGKMQIYSKNHFFSKIIIFSKFKKNQKQKKQKIYDFHKIYKIQKIHVKEKSFVYDQF